MAANCFKNLNTYTLLPNLKEIRKKKKVTKNPNRPESTKKKQPLKSISDIVAQIACVYIIRKNSHNRLYVGQTTDMRNRMNDHSTALMKGKKGSNPKMRSKYSRRLCDDPTNPYFEWA